MLGRGRGHLVNISSMAGVATFPGSRGLRREQGGADPPDLGAAADLRGQAVGTLAVELGPVRSEMMGRISGHAPAAAAFGACCAPGC